MRKSTITESLGPLGVFHGFPLPCLMSKRNMGYGCYVYVYSPQSLVGKHRGSSSGPAEPRHWAPAQRIAQALPWRKVNVGNQKTNRKWLCPTPTRFDIWIPLPNLKTSDVIAPVISVLAQVLISFPSPYTYPHTNLHYLMEFDMCHLPSNHCWGWASRHHCYYNFDINLLYLVLLKEMIWYNH